MFIRENTGALLFVLFACLSELWYVECSYFSEELYNIGGVSYDRSNFLYSFFNQLGYLNLLPSILLYRSAKNQESKGIYLGLVVWNGYEMLQELNYLFKLDIEFLSKIKNMSNTWLQILFILFVVALTYRAYKKWKSLYP